MATLLRATQVWLRFSGTTGTTGILSYYINTSLASLLRATQVWLGFSGTTGTTGILRYYRFRYITQIWLHFYALLRYG